MKPTPPYSLEAEQSILGACLISASAVDTARTLLEAEDFYLEPHQRLFAAIDYLAQREEPVDVMTVPEELSRRPRAGYAHDLAAIGGLEYINLLAETVPTAVHAEHYAQLVADYASLRKAATGMEELQGQIREGGTLEAVTEGLSALTDRVMVRKGLAEPISARRSAQDAVARYTGDKPRGGIATGLPSLDHLTGGWQDTDLIILAARPSLGKSAAMLHHLRWAAQKEVSCLCFSLEMSEKQLVDRMLASLMEVDSKRLRHFDAQDGELCARLSRACGFYGEYPLFIDERGGLALTAIRGAARRWRRKHAGPALIAIDYLQLLDHPAKSSSEAHAIEHNANGLKAMAKELGCPVLCLSQLNRETAKGTSKRPQLHELRGSGGIEQAADLVLFLHRDGYYETLEAKDNQPLVEPTWPQGMEFILAKQRNGSVGTVWTEYDAPTGIFQELSARHGDQEAPPEKRWS